MMQDSDFVAKTRQLVGSGTHRKPQIWDYLHGYDGLYTGTGVSTVSGLATLRSPQPGTVVVAPRLRFTCTQDNPGNTLPLIAKGGIGECIFTIGKNEWEPASILAAEDTNSSLGTSLLNALLRRLTGLDQPSADTELEASIVVLPRRQPMIFSSVLSIRPKELPRRKVSYIGDVEDVGDE